MTTAFPSQDTLEIPKGADHEIVFFVETLTNDALPFSATNPYIGKDFTGYAAKADFRRSYNSKAEFSLSTTDASITLGANGRVALKFAEEKTEVVKMQGDKLDLVWDIRFTNTSTGQTTLLFVGSVATLINISTRE
jgi:hypothetical protein